jgi:hypothetical protein
MEKGGVMTRKDSEKDAERPHYYSQFWLDIAAGRRVIGGPKPEDAEANEAEILEPAPLRKAGRSADTLKETRASAVAEPEVEEEEELEQDTTVEEGEIPNIVFDEDAELAPEVAEESFNEEEPESEDEEFFEEEEEEEEEEDEEEWGRRGGARKKAKPTRPVKPVKKPKREIRRNF